MKIDHVFSKQDLAEIESAVARAEDRAPGEIVPYIVGRSDRYPEALWKGAAIGAALGAAIWAVLDFGEWAIDPVSPVLYTAAGAILGFVLAHLPGLRRRLAGKSSLDRRVEQRARAAFLEREVFATSGRSGMLLFVSIFERRALVLADAGIPVRPEGETWGDVGREISEGIAAGHPARAISAAIERLGTILARREAGDIAKGVKGADELPDAPVMKEE